jgi:hypothetical protein
MEGWVPHRHGLGACGDSLPGTSSPAAAAVPTGVHGQATRQRHVRGTNGCCSTNRSGRL